VVNEQLIYHLASLQERERLSRELHDQLAPGLGYIRIQTALMSEALNEGDLKQVRRKLGEINELANDLYTDVREGIFNLRTQLSNAEEFWPTLEEYVTEYEGRYDLEVDLVCSNGAQPRLPVKAANQVLRIIQGALSNVRSHAEANRVIIRIDTHRDQTEITVEDDGKGFDPNQFGKNGHSFGLEIMRERAQSIGGRLTLDTAPGAGTRLSVRLANQQQVMRQPKLQL
jgi:two-component system nitrate/nitrite sensor histidine kinase NarX